MHIFISVQRPFGLLVRSFICLQRVYSSDDIYPYDDLNSLGTESTALLGELRARRGKLLTWAIYFRIVSATISIQTYNRKIKYVKKNREAADICDIRAVCGNF